MCCIYLYIHIYVSLSRAICGDEGGEVKDAGEDPCHSVIGERTGAVPFRIVYISLVFPPPEKMLKVYIFLI